ncbi:DNA polymerase III subunit delta [Cereibacter sphaeroides]|uniref:DNA polymerase III subunit delta n=1 Tax=Cereibacter sphaeroides TaxID=1063 RepID=UPI001F1B74C0|nr:DNA polymerase III subunit delta [Cereibacter sphaeroides]MCE6949990.1 DNA polymerase III subunit delta [Cereibacter sphaeroides]
MILKGAEAARYLARPDPSRAGLLIFGQDAMRVALKRQEAIAALIGPEGAAEMRLSRLPAADLRRDPAALMDAMTAKGFFAGPRAVLVDEAGDGLAELVGHALKAWRPGDAQLVVTAGGLTGKSALKKLIEAHPNAVCIGLYDDPPTRDEIEAMLRQAGLGALEPAATAALSALSREIDPGDLRQTVEKLALYKLGDPAPLSAAEVAALAPASIEAGVDDLLHAVAEGRRAEVAPLVRRLEAQGVNAVTLCIGALRHFRNLHRIATGAEAGRPGYNPRREQMQRQSQRWGVQRLEEALRLLVETDLTLRSTSRAPAMAVMERALIRLCNHR